MREDEEARLLSWGSFLLLFIVLDLCYALGEGGVTTIIDNRKCQRGISEGVYPPRELRVFKKRLDKPIVNP